MSVCVCGIDERPNCSSPGYVYYFAIRLPAVLVARLALPRLTLPRPLILLCNQFAVVVIVGFKACSPAELFRLRALLICPHVSMFILDFFNCAALQYCVYAPNAGGTTVNELLMNLLNLLHTALAHTQSCSLDKLTTQAQKSNAIINSNNNNNNNDDDNIVI